MNVISDARDLSLSVVDLTRACAAHELYDPWCSRHAQSSATIAEYITAAAIELQQQLNDTSSVDADPFVARETLADTLMATSPLSHGDLVSAVRQAIADATIGDPGTATYSEVLL